MDARIITVVCPRTGVCRAHTVLYDKRREPCYEHIPVVQYSHVSSAIAASVGRNVLLGQLHRFAGIIMDRDNFVRETARCVAALVARGHAREAMENILRGFCRHRFFVYGDTHAAALLTDLLRGVDDALVPAA